MRTIADLIGLTLTKIDDYQSCGDQVIAFTVDNGDVYKLYHDQDCCESVGIEKVEGDLQNLVGSPITIAFEENPDLPALNDDGDYGSYTWTQYTIGTTKGTVVILWYGSSNGYYSESVTFCKVGESRWE